MGCPGLGLQGQTQEAVASCLEMVAWHLVGLMGRWQLAHPSWLASVLERRELVREGLVAPGPSMQGGGERPPPPRG